MPVINKDEWQPSGDLELEPNAWKALTYSGNALVKAGPGAGKTEFLAQRSLYLLETGECLPPRRILAISFKKDAAKNLAVRVSERASGGNSTRFTSMTFDAFAKRLVDQFRECLPQVWRPTRDYSIEFPKLQLIRSFLEHAAKVCPNPEWIPGIRRINPRNFERDWVGKMQLPVGDFNPPTHHHWVVKKWWQEFLFGQESSTLTFQMITKLAELVLRANLGVKSALNQTYPYVFLDEFQDTTHGQYAFLKAAFLNSKSTLTAVGDCKQRIMSFAGAKGDIFERFCEDFQAEEIDLVCNYRSSPSLVKMQHIFALELEDEHESATSMAKSEIDGEVSQAWCFDSTQEEATRMAQWIRRDMDSAALVSRDYALLVKQRADLVEASVSQAFTDQGLMIRNESKKVGELALQDILAEDFSAILIAFLKLGTGVKDAALWSFALESLIDLRNANPSDKRAVQNIQRLLKEIISKIKGYYQKSAITPDSASGAVLNVVNEIGLESFAACYPQYSTGDYLEQLAASFEIHAKESSHNQETWQGVWDNFEGLDQIPLMTVHKSKGLEYHTVFFMRLDDDQWWNHAPGNAESLATFFVAFTRARQRVFFTYCRNSDRQKVSDLYVLLRNAGITEVIGSALAG